mgnify:CR=1 FL=1
MSPFDPTRPQTAGGVPAWRDAPMLTLPSLVLTPAPVPETETYFKGGYWDIKFMFPSIEHSNAFHWVGKVFDSNRDRTGDTSEMEDFLYDWETGPEEAIKKWLDLEPPGGKWWRLPPRRDAPDAEPETAKAAEELDL